MEVLAFSLSLLLIYWSNAVTTASFFTDRIEENKKVATIQRAFSFLLLACALALIVFGT